MVQDWRDIAVVMGLGAPASRAFVAGVAATTLLYAAGYPKESFNEDGSMRPFAPITPGPYGVTSKHFLVIPVVVAGAVFLFT